MSSGYLLQFFNHTWQPVTLKATLKNSSHWEFTDKLNPAVDLLDPTTKRGIVVEPHSHTPKYHEEITGNPAEFTVTFSVPFVGASVKILDVTANASDVTEGSSYKRSLKRTGTAADDLRILQAEYDQGEGDSWRNMALAIYPAIDKKNWMSRLSESLSLSDITIPGTHDSGTHVHDILPVSITQTWTIGRQLSEGIRFLDIRLNKSNGFEIVHGESRTGLYFEKDCVAVIANFLKNEGPKETILLSIQSERGTTDGFHDGVLEILERVVGKYNLFTGAQPGPLSSLRGSVVLLRRYWIDPATNTHQESDKSKSGVNLHDLPANNKWWPANSDTFDELGDGKYQANSEGINFAIQDWYDLQTSWYKKKIELMEKYLDAAVKAPDNVWFLNFTSCGTSAREGNPDDFAKGETELNASLFRYLATHTGARQRYGTVVMDFPEYPEELITALIRTNNI